MLPFLFEGLIQGFIGSIMSLLILFISFKYVEAKLFAPIRVFLGYEEITFMPIHFLIFFLFVGLFIGTIGSLFASGKTLRIDKEYHEK